ncbi:MAG: serine hydrolase [Acidimicrobiales bacterium]
MALALAAAVVGTATGPAGAARPQFSWLSPAVTASLPGTPAGQQARWFVGAVLHVPLPAAEIRAHFDAAFLAAVPPAQLNATLRGVTAVQVGSVTASTPDAIVFLVTVNGATKLTVSLAVDAHGLISGLFLRPAGAPPSAPPVPSTWAGVDRMVRSVAPQVRLLVASVGGGTCQAVNAIGATTPAPLGSAFKLYVLDALAEAIASGHVSWAQELTITSRTKSLLGGVLDNEPDGTRVPVKQVASDMISISDNTAADMLISLVGRGAVEAVTRATGMADPALDVPFLTTRELLVLKLDDWPKLAQRYLALSPAGRLALLTGTVDRVPTAPFTSAWTKPRDINTLEWFASPTDICHVYASLAALARRPELAPLASVLSLNPGDMSLPPAEWRSVWFKGGSEPGVLTLNYLATTKSGHTYVVSVLAANPLAPISQTSAVLALVSAAKGAFELAAR